MGWILAVVVVGCLLVVTAALLAIFVIGMRRRSPRVIGAVRRLSRATKRLPLKSAGRDGSYAAVVQHVGRRSGRQYETPVHAVQADEGFVIALPYGSDGDWVRNVLASASAVIRFEGADHHVAEPRLVHLGDYARYFSRQDRRAHRLFGVREALLVIERPPAPPQSPASSAAHRTGPL